MDRLTRDGGRFELSAGERHFEADNVVVAMATHQVPWVPPVARELDPSVVQLHAADYTNPSQLREGGSLVVGVGNSGAEISVELAGSHHTWLAGRETGHVPVNIDGLVARYVFQPLLFGLIAHYVLTVNTPVGRRVRPRILAHGAPLVRIKPKDLAAAGVERVPRVAGVRDGLPLLEDGRVLDVGNVIWCTGFRPDFTWIDLRVFEDDRREPIHHRGIVDNEPGLYFLGLFFLYALSSGFFRGVGRDAGYVVKTIAARKD